MNLQFQKRLFFAGTYCDWTAISEIFYENIDFMSGKIQKMSLRRVVVFHKKYRIYQFNFANKITTKVI